MSAAPDLLKIKIFQNKGYEVIILDYHVTSRILSRDSNYIVEVFMWPNFGKFSIYIREVIITSILSEKGGLGSSSITWDWH